jgi:hypothetical protein
MLSWFDIVDNRENVSFICNIIDTTDKFTHIICAHCKSKKIIQYLIQKSPLNLLQPNHLGYYPIHEICFSQPPEIIELVINSNKFDLFITDEMFHQTPLHILSWRQDRKQVVSIFLEHERNNDKLNSCLFESIALHCGDLTTPAKILQYFGASHLLKL